MNNRFLQLFSCAKLVKGSIRSGICDVQRGRFETIPFSMYKILLELENSSLFNVLSKYSQSEQKIINEYVVWLINNEYAFYCKPEEKNLFPKIQDSFTHNRTLHDAIIDINNSQKFDYTNILEQLSHLNTTHVQLRSYDKIDFHFYKKIIASQEMSPIESIDICTKFTGKHIDFSDLIVKSKRLNRINNIIFHSSDKEEVLEWEGGLTKIIYTKQKIENNHCCGKIHSNFFSVNLKTFTESQNYNTCLNRKISIDVNGEIKNCPSMQKSYGNIKDTTLEEALNKKGFKDVWHIKKDDIKICQDCEFRHICTDCRAYIDNPKDIYSHPAKCTYNPYQAKWKDEEGYTPVTEMTEEEIAEIKAEYA